MPPETEAARIAAAFLKGAKPVRACQTCVFLKANPKERAVVEEILKQGGRSVLISRFLRTKGFNAHSTTLDHHFRQHAGR